jgi:glycosyltransferase involved in cell wall biosynthesis
MSFQTDLGAFIGFLRKIPVILTPHGSLLGYDYLYDSFLSKLPYRLHDVLTLKLPTKISKYVIATSQAEFRDCIKFGISKNKIQIIPLSFTPPSNFISCKKYSTEKTKILFVGRIVPLKNLDVLIKSISILKNDIPNIQFTIIGDEIQGRLRGDVGYKERLTSLVKTLNVNENIRFEGWKTNNRLWEYYQNSDLFLFGSIYENFGRPLLEAASFGIPLVSTDVGVARDLIGNDEGGILLSKLDEKYISDKIKELLKDEKRYVHTSKHVQISSKNFSIKSISNKYEKIFARCIKNE